MKTNFHTHTQRCRHAQGCAEDYLRAALDSGLSVLGFSDHAPFPDFDYGYRMSFSELEDYIAEVAQLKQDYAGKISLYTGLEIEYLPQYERSGRLQTLASRSSIWPRPSVGMRSKATSPG